VVISHPSRSEKSLTVALLIDTKDTFDGQIDNLKARLEGAYCVIGFAG